MENLITPTEEIRDNLNKAGIESFKNALRTFVIGSIVSFLFVLLAISTFIFGTGDSAGPGFFIFILIAIAVFAITCVISLVKSAIGLMKSMTISAQDHDSKNDIKDSITKNITLILGILLALLLVYKLLM